MSDATSTPAAQQDRDPSAGEPSVKVLLRLSGEIATKSRRTRSRFQRRLVENLRDAFESAGVDARIDRRWSRIFVTAEDDRVLDVLGHVFGLSSFSRIEVETPASLDAIVEAGRQRFHDRVRGHTFAVRARRSGEHPFRSIDVQRELGAALNPGARVDLDDPEVEVRVEVRDDRAYLFSERRAGAGGLPAGVQGGALALISGGFDSVVAAWMVQRRGAEVDYLFCNLGGAAYRRMVTEVAMVLSDRWSFGLRPRLHVVDFVPVVERMEASVDGAYRQVVLKRLMYRAAARVADDVGASALVTGEAIGQVSSQTLTNLRAIEEAGGSYPVLRPLVGFDKEEIVARARTIGTFDLSARVREYCSLTGGHPVTAGSPERAREEERRLEPSLLEEAVRDREVVDLRSLSRSEVAGAGLFVDAVGSGDVLVDTREGTEGWRPEGAEERVPFEELARDFGELDREATYVLLCEEGTRTAHLAERMQRAGYEAYSYRGGARRMRREAGGKGGRTR